MMLGITYIKSLHSAIGLVSILVTWESDALQKSNRDGCMLHLGKVVAVMQLFTNLLLWFTPWLSCRSLILKLEG